MSIMTTTIALACMHPALTLILSSEAGSLKGATSSACWL